MKRNSGWFLVAYLLLRRLVRIIRRDGISGLVGLEFATTTVVVIALVLAYRPYKQAKREYVLSASVNTDNLKAIGELPESYEHTCSKPTILGLYTTLLFNEEAGAAVEDKAGGIITFVVEGIKKLVYFLLSRSVVFVVYGLWLAAIYHMSGLITYLLAIGFVIAFSGYLLVELEKSETYCEWIRPHLMKVFRPADEFMTKFEVFVLGIRPRPEEIPKTLRREWGVPEPDEYDGKVTVEKVDGRTQIILQEEVDR